MREVRVAHELSFERGIQRAVSVEVARIHNNEIGIIHIGFDGFSEQVELQRGRFDDFRQVEQQISAARQIRYAAD